MERKPTITPGLKWPRLSELTLRDKILLLACSLSLFTAIAMGVATSMRTQSLVSEFAETNIAHETRLVAQQVKGTYSELENDAFVISRTPPINGLMRSQINGGNDPLEKSTAEQWKKRLELNFTALMAERPNYTQIRFIGLANGGRELVRVNRIDGAFFPVSVAMLQKKAEESYFQRAITLKPDEAYFSEVTYNREFGDIDEDLIPTIRSVVPIFDENEKLFGMIVINADYRAIMEQYFAEVSLQREVVISNEAGDFITHLSDGTVSKFNFHDADGYQVPSFLAEFRDYAQQEWVSTDPDALSYSVRLPVDRDLDGSHIVISITVPNDEVYAPARKTILEWLGLTLVMLVLTLLLTYYLAVRMTNPLSNMTRTIEQAAEEDESLDLPVDRKDEVGKLARAFYNLTESRKEYSARVSAVINNVVDAIISIDSAGNILSYNPASELLFGYAPEEVIGRNVKILMPPAIAHSHDGYLAAFHQTGETHSVGITRELEAVRKDGSLFPMELSVSKINLSDGSHMFTGIIRDITERRQMAVMQNEFVSTVNHELRTPLTSIRASLGILQRLIAGQVDQKAEKLVSISLRGCERLSRLVNDILDQEKIASGMMDFHLENVDIVELSTGVVDRHHSLAEYYDVRFDLKSGFDIPLFANVDPARFNQALVNLLSNAAKFSPAGEVVTIDLALLQDGDKMAISVCDNGPGIPVSFREKLFQRFAQADSSATRAKGGSGLGLNITKTIVEAFGGTIDFKSVEGEGSTFTITLPVCAAPAQLGNDQCQAA